MKRWKETTEILRQAALLARAGQRAALATVVRVAGSAYRRPGAKLLVGEDANTLGSISGGCLEADVREVALRVMADATPRWLHYDTGDDDDVSWGLGLGCSGSVDVFVQDAMAPDLREPFARMRELLEGERAFSVSTLVKGPGRTGGIRVAEGDGTSVGSTGDADLDRALARRAADQLARSETTLHRVASCDIFTEILAPPPHLAIFGAGDDAIALCAYARDAGFRVTVVDHRAGLLLEKRFPGAWRLRLSRPEDPDDAAPLSGNVYAVVQTHSLTRDREWIRRLLASEVAYIGVLGPRARTQEMLRQIGAGEDARVFGPVGLDLGAEGPEQVALSIVAELLSVWSCRPPASLRARDGAIHAT